jgi:hypothetical protein
MEHLLNAEKPAQRPILALPGFTAVSATSPPTGFG